MNALDIPSSSNIKLPKVSPFDRQSTSVLALINDRRAELSLSFVPRVGFRRKGHGVPGLTDQIRLKLCAANSPTFRRRRPGAAKSVSSAKRGRALDHIMDLLYDHKLALDRAPPVLQWWATEIARREWKPVSTQVIAAWKYAVATSVDEILYGDGGLVIVERKSGSIDDEALFGQWSTRNKFLHKGPFKDHPLVDSQYTRHQLQAAISAHLIAKTYGSRSLRVTGVYLVYLDRRAVIRVDDQEWFKSDRMEAVCKHFRDSNGPTDRKND